MVFHPYCSSFAFNIREHVTAFIFFMNVKIIIAFTFLVGILIIAMGFIKEIIIAMASAGQIIIILGLLSISYFSLMDYSF